MDEQISVAFIEEMLEACMDQVTGHGKEFIESLYDQWETKRSLTPKQVDALYKFYDKLR